MTADLHDILRLRQAAEIKAHLVRVCQVLDDFGLVDAMTVIAWALKIVCDAHEIHGPARQKLMDAVTGQVMRDEPTKRAFDA